MLFVVNENRGLNRTTVENLAVDSISRLDDRRAHLTVIKGRNKAHETLTVTVGGLRTLGGLMRHMTLLTRFVRHRRRQNLPPDATPAYSRQADLLMTAGRRARSVSFRSAWVQRFAREHGVAINVSALRQTAIARARREGTLPNVSGQVAATTLAYLRRGLSAAQRHELVTVAQSDMLDLAMRAVQPTRPSPPPDSSVAVGVADCTTGRTDPESAQPCRRGIIGCFFCPSGWRSERNIPGLKAMAQLTTEIQQRDVSEWRVGPAQMLHTLATEVLSEFDDDLVARTDPRPALPLVTHLYRSAAL